MLLNKIGEFGLIDRIRRRIKTDPSVIKGIGDDCAVLEFDKDKYLLSTCDMLVEGVDFTVSADPYLIGRKALAVSISDIAACAGNPRYALISLGLPKDCTVKFIDRFLQGVLDLARTYKVNIVGGDLSRARQVTIDVSMLGFVEKKYLVLRSGAKINDIIISSGTFGGSLSGKHFKFTPRVKEARYLTENFRINSMIDVSDGLAQDLNHILDESKKGALIYEALIPLSKEAKSLKDALYSGEDFELVFTMPPKEAKRLLAKRNRLFKPIGEITEEKGLRLIDEKNREKLIKPAGFRHF